MGISSLPIQSIKRLSDVVTDIEDVLIRRDALMEDADALKDKRDKAIELQSKLDSKALEFSKLSTSIDAKELKEIIEKLEDVSVEIEQINDDYKTVYRQIVDLSEIKDRLSKEYEEIIKQVDLNNKETEDGLFVENINTKVYIIDAPFPEDKDKISPLNCEIISCSENFVNDVLTSYSRNINKIITADDAFDFDKFNNEINEYKKEKNNSLDKMLEFVNKSKENITNENQVDENLIQEVIMNNTSEQPEEEENANKSFEQVITEDINNKTMENVPEENISVEPIQPVQEEVVNNTSEQVVEEEKPELQTPLNDIVVSHDTETSNSALDKQIEEIANNTQAVDNIISIDELMNQNANDNVIADTNNSVIEDTNANVASGNETYIDKNNVLNKMTRATKEKLHNKITKIFEGSYPETIIKPLQNINDINSNNNVNIDNFLNNKAA